MSKPRPGDPHGGVGFLVRKGIQFLEGRCNSHKNQYGLEFSEITIITKEGNMHIVCVYCPPRGKAKKRNPGLMIRELERHLTLCTPPGDTVVLGDFNAHETTFGARDTNQAGKELKDLVTRLGFTLLYEPVASTYSYTAAHKSHEIMRSCPDLAFASHRMAHSAGDHKRAGRRRTRLKKSVCLHQTQ